MTTYNGHKNWTHWNVSLWLFNNQGLYSMMRDAVRRAGNRDVAAREILADLAAAGITHTPDGARYSFTAIRAAIVGWYVRSL